MIYLCAVLRAAYACFLWEAGIVQVRWEPPGFRWASGRESPIYVDHRRLLGYPEWRHWAVEAMLKEVKGRVPFAAVVGVATGGIPWAAWIGEALGLPVGYVRPEPKSHGLTRQVEGLPVGIGPVLLVEDLISTGGSVQRAAAALHREGWPVSAVAVLWSYELPEASALSVPIYAVLRFPEALLYWEQAGLLPSQAAVYLKRWVATQNFP